MLSLESQFSFALYRRCYCIHVYVKVLVIWNILDTLSTRIVLSYHAETIQIMQPLWMKAIIMLSLFFDLFKVVLLWFDSPCVEPVGLRI